MECRDAKRQLVEWIDGELQDVAVSEAVRAHVADCAACAREVAQHRRTWEALGTLDAGEKGVGRERLEQMARTALAGAAANPSPGVLNEDEAMASANSTRRAPILSLTRVAPKWLAAAALVVAVAIGARLVLQRPEASDPAGCPSRASATIPSS